VTHRILPILPLRVPYTTGGVAICTVRVIGKREHALVLLQWYGMCCAPLVRCRRCNLTPGVASAWFHSDFSDFS